MYEVYECFPCMYIWAPPACNAYVDQKKESLELELQIPVSCHMGAKTQTQALCKNIKCA